jgi:hypothetical protein
MDRVTKLIVARKDEERKCFAEDGEILIAASPMKRARVKVRKLDHYFVGLHTGNPALYGWVTEASTGTSIEDIIKLALQSEAKENIGEKQEKIKEQVYFTLESIQNIKIGTPVVTDFTEKSFMDKTLVQCIHKVFLSS